MRSNGRRKRSIGGGEDPIFSPNSNRVAAVRVTCGLENCRSRARSYSTGRTSE